MPFLKRIVEPQYLSNAPLPAACERELDTVSNNTLCGLVRQLADLSLRASDIFSDINADAHLLADKTISLRRRVTRLEDRVEKLDARSVRVPESSLEEYKNTTGHYRASHKIDQDLFVQGTRPACVQLIYDGASTDLKDIYAKFKEYHEDEVTVISMKASSLMSAEIKAQSQYDIVFPRRDIILPSPDQKKENLPNPKRTQRPLSETDIMSTAYLQRVQSPLPTPEEVLRKHVGPSTLVTVDTSGTGFERMSNIRRSLNLTFRFSSRSKKERKEKKAWRRTVSGIPQEVEEELRRGRPRSNSGSEYTSSSSAEFEELRTQSLDRKLKYSVREFNKAYEAKAAAKAAAKATAKSGSKALEKDGKQSVAVVAPLRNRRRHRHSLGDPSKLEKALNLNGSASLPRGLGLLRPNSVPPGGAMGTVQFSDGSTDSSMERIWQTSAMNRLNEKAESSKHNSLCGQPGNGKPQLFLPQMSQLPNAYISTQASLLPAPSNAGRGDDRQHHHHHHHHPVRPDPAELAASVRLRMQKSGIRKEDRRSSSGNWSGTDSTRTSVCSSEQDSQGNAPSNMDASPSDSAVSLSNEIDPQGAPVPPIATVTFPGLINGDGPRPSFLPVQKSSHTSSSGSPTPTNEIEAGGTFTRLDTETWLKSVGASKAAGMTQPSSSTETGNVAPSVKGPGTLKPQLSFGDSSSESSVENAASIVSDNTSLDLDAAFGDTAEGFHDNDSLSEFSVDQEGYWTSMHSDCGLSPKHANQPQAAGDQPQSVGYDCDIASHYRGKDSRKGFITPRNKGKRETVQQPTTQPKRDDAFALDSQLGTLNMRKGLDGSPISMDSSSASNQTLTNESDGSRSVTPAPSDMSDISSASYDLPPPLGSPNEGKMYTLFYGNGHKAQSGLPMSRAGPSPGLTLPSSVTSGGIKYTQTSLLNTNGRLATTTSAPVTTHQSSRHNHPHVSVGMKNHFPSASPAVTSSNGGASDFWATPTPVIPGAMLKARERFYGYKPSGRTESQSSQATSESDTDTITPVTSPKMPNDPQNVFFGMYPGSYSVIKKKPRDSTYTIYSNGMTSSLINKPAEVISPTNSLDRKQKFNQYISELQSQAPQTYDALNQLKIGEERTKAMSREQRIEILEQMRKSKLNGRNDSMATTPTTPTTPPVYPNTPPAYPTTPPVYPTTCDVSTMLAMSSAAEAPMRQEEPRTTSFRSSYKEGVSSKHLDPDLAIIHAANRMENNVNGPDSGEQYGDLVDGVFDDLERRPVTPRNVNGDASDEYQRELYVFDPKRQPGSSILKVGKRGEKLKSANHKSKKKSKVSTDPFAETTIGQMMAADSPYDIVPSKSRTIRFSETVTVENQPVRVCLVSGKPRTHISDFKALLQQQSLPSSARTVSACYALNVRSDIKGPRNAELLYRGILQEEDAARNMEAAESTESPEPERKIVTINDLKNAMASAKGNIRMVDVEEAKGKHEIVNKSSCATVTAIPEVAELPIRETVINGDDYDEDGEVHCDEHHEDIDLGKLVMNNVPSGTAETSKANAEQCNSGETIGAASSTPELLSRAPEVLSCNNSNNNDVQQHSGRVHFTLETITENVSEEVLKTPEPEPEPSSNIRRLPKHSWSDTDLNRSDLMAAIRNRGQKMDSRETAVAQLEEAMEVANKSSPVRRSLPVSRSEGSIHSLLDSVKHSIQKMSPKHEPQETGDMEYSADAWD